jgi:hypothetical protein
MREPRQRHINGGLCWRPPRFEAECIGRQYG